MASPQTVQPSTADNQILENVPNTNYGTETYCGVAPTTNARAFTLLTFDFSTVVPVGATITLATLSLYCAYSLENRTITCYRLLRTDWHETQSTWNIYKTSNNWGTAGALNATTDYTTTDAATATSVAVGQWLNETVTAQVQTALDSVAGVAHFLLVDAGATNASYNMYRSRSYATTSLRPKLYIEYTAPPFITGINIGDVVKAIDWTGSKINVGDAWKATRTVKVNIADAWKRVYSSPAVLNEDATYILLESGTDDRIEVE
jgi:hypothetical protein